jgi:hypothetical protein
MRHRRAEIAGAASEPGRGARGCAVYRDRGDTVGHHTLLRQSRTSARRRSEVQDPCHAAPDLAGNSWRDAVPLRVWRVCLVCLGGPIAWLASRRPGVVRLACKGSRPPAPRGKHLNPPERPGAPTFRRPPPVASGPSRLPRAGADAQHVRGIPPTRPADVDRRERCVQGGRLASAGTRPNMNAEDAAARSCAGALLFGLAQLLEITSASRRRCSSSL